ncbi:auxin-responsive protein [Cyclospora cayetanensis]|uniref:Auxin-responsive protein n=1 Tax=Cyclospora cayetanensis TaxID=88456 RepID=A0A1D3D8C4_9EIME|nr:auxin-responsive protein [Cyclospora cayetanensis]
MRWRGVLLLLPLLVLLQFLLRLFLIHLSSPKEYSLKNRFLDTGYGLFRYEVDDDLCTTPESGELVRPPSLVLQQADALLQNHPQLANVIGGGGGKRVVGAPPHSVHWVFRFARSTARERLELRQHLLRLEDTPFYLESSDSGSGFAATPALDLSPELSTAAFLYATCKQRHKAAFASSKETPPQAYRLETQMFLPSRFLGDVQRLCGNFRREAEEESAASHGDAACTPSLETALQLVPLRLHRWWGKVRWQYHMSEFARKPLTVWWPLNPYMHMLYRQDMYAMLALMSPYLELEPLVAIDSSCRPPDSYWVVPLPREQWKLRFGESVPHRRESAEGATPSVCEGAAPEGPFDLDGGKQSPRGARSSSRQPLAPSSPLSNPTDHNNYVPAEEYCRRAREVHYGFFTGEPRSKPIKIVDAVILGYDLDLLEIRWHELYHSVDYFVVAEAHHHTLGVFQKPLFFDRNKDRYAAFSDKIIHLVQPFEASLPVAQRCSRRLLGDEDKCWEYEMFQRDSMLHMLAQINAGVNNYGNAHIAPGFLEDTDLVLVSDVDEIVMGDRLRHLKYCETFPQRQFGWVVVHYPGRVDAMALKDFQVMSRISETPFPNAIGPLVDAVVSKASSCAHAVLGCMSLAAGAPTDKERDRRGTMFANESWRLTGLQLLDTSYLPFLYAKVPSDDLKPGYEPWSLYTPLLAQRGILPSPVGGLLQAQVAAWKDFRDYRQVGSLCVNAKDAVWESEGSPEEASLSRRKIAQHALPHKRLEYSSPLVPDQYRRIGFGMLPWLMRCNPTRYPTWFQQADPRYFMQPRSSFVIYGETVNARSLEEWFSIFRFVRDTYSADITRTTHASELHP